MVLVDYQWHGKCVLHVHQLATVFICWALGYMRTEVRSLQKLLYYIDICLCTLENFVALYALHTLSNGAETKCNHQ